VNGGRWKSRLAGKKSRVATAALVREVKPVARNGNALSPNARRVIFADR
jgi:hypothetical protein